ncbi:UDP-glucose/GDP-mannose dehydrogenase family protein [Eubacteriales bacterium mix99]|nr:UDP-glucose 6-dehydrogenase [Clostridiales bacterium]
MKIAVAGTGYVGLVTGVCLAEMGHDVVCVDIDEEKVRKMESGKSPIYEPGLEELMKKNRERLTFTTDYQNAYRIAKVIFIGVGTPEKKDGSANLKYVYEVAGQIAKSVEQDSLVVIKSTVPIGTNDRIERLLKERVRDGLNIEVASNPEFLAQGTAVRDTLHASRIVIGVESPQAEKVLRDVYRNFDRPLVVTDRRSAEMIKYASNDFLALKVSYINEIANVCDVIGANVDDVVTGMGMDPRIGSRFLKPGIGYGGSCFPKDTRALHWLASFHDYELKTVKAAIEVNENQKIKLIKKARQYYEDFNGLKAAALGLTFKPGTDDLREAPSLSNIPILLEDGMDIRAWDPIGMDSFRRLYPDGITYCESMEEALNDTDICFIFTEWPEIADFSLSGYAERMRTPIILDGRNCYRLEDAEKAPVLYDSIGRRVVGKYKK